MTKFKPKEDMMLDAFFSCNVFGCESEAEKLYSTETQIIDVCINHYAELTK